MNNIITRFAPSPTGFIHIGNIRTALYAWLYAKKNNGKFLIRIDDTDYTRNSQKYTNNIFNILNWLKLNTNENITYQSKNLKIYENIIKNLIVTGNAYKCFCSKERLSKLKEYQIKNKKKIKYDNFCKNKKPHKTINKFIVRFNNNNNNNIEFIDEINGKIITPISEIDDFIIAKNNYFPTYNLASTVDDINLNVSHIIRGNDHIPNTPKQILIMNALDATIPKFIHLPMILDKNKNILSKRNSSSDISLYKNEGFLPEAILNYILKLGWGYKNKEIFSLNEMIKLFNFKNISKSPSIMNEDKLFWLNKFYLKKDNIKNIRKNIITIEKKFHINYRFGPTINTLIEFNKHRAKTIKEIITNYDFLYKENIKIDYNLLSKYFNKNNIKIIKIIYNKFKDKKFIWSLDNIKDIFKNITIEYNLKLTEIAIPIRIIITGSIKPNPLYEIIFLSGRILILKKFLNIIKRMGL